MVQLHFFCMWIFTFQPLVERWFFSIWWPWRPCQNHLIIYVKVYLWTCYLILLVCMVVFMSLPHCFDYSGFLISFEIRNCASSSFILFKIVFTILWFTKFKLLSASDINFHFYNGLDCLRNICVCVITKFSR